MTADNFQKVLYNYGKKYYDVENVEEKSSRWKRRRENCPGIRWWKRFGAGAVKTVSEWL